MNQIVKTIYYLIPGKRHFYHILRVFYRPTFRTSGYLKFKGIFSLMLPNGGKVKLYNDNSTLPTLLFWNGLKAYESCSLEVWCKLSTKSSVVLDLGANFGLFGLLSKAIQKQSKVILFEPLERNVQRVKRNFEINKLEAEVHAVAIGDSVGTVTFFDMKSEENTIGSIDRSFVEGHKHHAEIFPIEVPLLSIDAYVEKSKIASVDLMKIDVEGADYMAIKGAFATLSKFRPHILIEITNNKSADSIAELINTLPFKYNLYELNDASGVLVKDVVSRDGESRNYLFSTLNSAQLLSVYDIKSS